MKVNFKTSLLVLIAMIYGNCYYNSALGSQLDNCLKAKTYSKIVDKGINGNGANKKNLLYTFQTEAGDKILFYYDNDSLGIASITKIKGNWYWKGIGNYDFISKSSDTTHMDAKFNLKTLDGNKFFIAFGKIIKPKVVKRIELSNPKTNAKVIGNQNNLFWVIIQKKDFNLLDVSAYDYNGKLLKN